MSSEEHTHKQEEQQSTPALNQENKAVAEEDTKICVLNFGKWVDKKPMEELLVAQNIPYQNVRKTRQQSYGFIVFETAEKRNEALQQLRGVEFNGKPLEVKAAKPKKGIQPLKRGLAADSKGRKAKRHQSDTNAVADQPVEAASVVDAVTPWHNVPYPEQLVRKQGDMRRVLVKFVRSTRKEYVNKMKRVEKEMKRQNRSSATPTAGTKSQPIPHWLNSEGCLYAVAGDVLYSKDRSHESSWEELGKAENVVAMVSFGANLVAVKNDGVYQWSAKRNVWDLCGRGEKDASIHAVASFKGELFCALSDKRIVRTKMLGADIDSVWENVAVCPAVPQVMTVHNADLYVACGETASSDMQFVKVALSSPVPSDIPAEPFSIALDDMVIAGLASHNGELLVATKSGGFYSVKVNEKGDNQNSIVKGTMALNDVRALASHKGLCCELDTIRPSPRVDEYRNKCEFSIGFDATGHACVGFRKGLFKDGSITIEAPTDCSNVPKSMKFIAAEMQKFVESSELGVFNRQCNKGVWRSLMVRWSDRTKELMVMVQANPAKLEEKVWEAEKKRLHETFTSLKEYPITSLYLQEYEGVSTPSEDHPVIHMHGKTHLREKLLGLEFDISPQAFFQVNTEAAEVLYTLVRELAAADEKTLLYDVCCGTGTIGICASKEAAKVVGIELCTAATKDANKNAALNSIENVTFVNSKAESVMADLLRQKRSPDEMHLDKVVAIVDPPRGGLHIDVIRALRSCKPVERIVYVSCNPTGTLVEDISRLCGPKTCSMNGVPFKPTQAAPVDLFPNTPHCELVVVLERLNHE